MKIDRRELLRYFGIGATITPVISGEPLLRAAATLVEPAKIDIQIAGGCEDLPRLWTDRLDNNPFERLWLARWRHEQSTYHILEHLLDRRPTSDERAVVAALMQWFGTNCGLGFLHGTFRAEGYSIVSSGDQNERKMREMYLRHRDSWPEFIMLRMKGGPPSITPS